MIHADQIALRNPSLFLKKVTSKFVLKSHAVLFLKVCSQASYCFLVRLLASTFRFGCTERRHSQSVMTRRQGMCHQVIDDWFMKYYLVLNIS